MAKEIDTYLTVKQFAKKHPWPTESALRAIIMHSDTNGFANVFVRMGKRVLIKEKLFFETVDKLNKNKVKGTK